MTRAAAILLLIGLASCQPAFAQSYSWYEDEEVYFPPAWPELTPSPDDPNCVRYTNYLQKPEGDLETIETPWGPVTFHFSRGDGKDPDGVEVIGVPDNILASPWAHVDVPENDHREFCFSPYLGF